MERRRKKREGEKVEGKSWEKLERRREVCSRKGEGIGKKRKREGRM